mmetsp:Transcript_10407/g.34473  ORF Transcript_10407/g.34473 Transcript_10407/m.34473 type:complete len:270 (-) Transcript_10407:256-1065(-)
MRGRGSRAAAAVRGRRGHSRRRGMGAPCRRHRRRRHGSRAGGRERRRFHPHRGGGGERGGQLLGCERRGGLRRRRRAHRPVASPRGGRRGRQVGGGRTGDTNQVGSGQRALERGHQRGGAVALGGRAEGDATARGRAVARQLLVRVLRRLRRVDVASHVGLIEIAQLEADRYARARSRSPARPAVLIDGADEALGVRTHHGWHQPPARVGLRAQRHAGQRDGRRRPRRSRTARHPGRHGKVHGLRRRPEPLDVVEPGRLALLDPRARQG